MNDNQVFSKLEKEMYRMVFLMKTGHFIYGKWRVNRKGDKKIHDREVPHDVDSTQMNISMTTLLITATCQVVHVLPCTCKNIYFVIIITCLS